MYPILIKIGPFVIYMYGVMVALGFVAGLFLALGRAKKEGIDENIVFDIALYSMIAGLVGGRIVEVLINFQYYRYNLLDIFKIWRGGLTFYGGFIAAIITGMVFLYKKHVPAWKVADIFAPSIALGHAIGRIGCFFAGCCYGRPTDFFLGVTFNHPASLAPLGVSVHPTQLYESFLNFVIFFLLFLYYKKKKFDGQIFSLYVIMYASVRFCIEFIRNDPRGPLFFSIFSISQIIALGFMVIAISMFWKLKNKNG